MAVNVNDVYQTVLLILNKEQRGYMTPEEFNRIASQVQLEIYNKTFEDYNQLVRQRQPDTGTADRIQDLENKLAPFRASLNAAGIAVLAGKIYSRVSLPANLYRLDRIVVNDTTEAQMVTFSELFSNNLSPLTSPTVNFPIFAFEQNAGSQSGGSQQIAFLPKQNNGVDWANSDFNIYYFTIPQNIVWGYSINPNGAYDYNGSSSIQFALVNSEFTNVVLRVLLYSGVVIRDPNIVQAAAGQIQKEEIQEKS
jgi:hypothetical protein